MNRPLFDHQVGNHIVRCFLVPTSRSRRKDRTFSNQVLIIATKDGNISAWSNDKKACEHKTPKNVTNMEKIFVESDKYILLITLEDGRFYLCTLKTVELSLKFSAEFIGHLPNPINTMCISEDKRKLATGCCFQMYQVS